MSPRSRYPFLIVVLLAVFAATTNVEADVRVKNVCVVTSLIPETDRSWSPDNECFSGHQCRVGLRGDWIDLTDRHSIESGPSANITIGKKGTGDGRGAAGSPTTCVPDGIKSSEGYVSLILTNISGTGTMRIKLSRPNAVGGRDEDFVSVNVKKGETFLATDREFHANYGEAEELNLRGGNLDLLQLKNPSPGDEILSKSDTQARVRLTFTRENSGSTTTVRLDQRLQFAGPEPAINARYVWPMVRLSSAPRPATGLAPNQPNIRPINPSAPFRPSSVNNGRQSGKVADTFCAGFSANDVRDVQVPAFTFSITNESNVDVSQTFTVDLTDGSGRILHTESVQGLGARATKVISVATWPGRQARAMLKNSQNVPCPPPGPCFSSPGWVYGCFVDSGQVTADPPTLVIKVDPTRSIPNEYASDNVLNVN